MNKLESNVIRNISITLVCLILLFIASKSLLLGSGIKFSTKDIWFVILTYLILNSSRKAFYIIAIPISLLYAIYSPIGPIFGPPNYKYIASILATDLLESKEFISQIPTKHLFLPVGIILPLILSRILFKKFGIEPHKNKTLLIILILIIFSNQKIYSFITYSKKSILEISSELNKLNEINKSDKWGEVSQETGNIDNFILVIGESVRKDYMHAYGYPVQNTSFIESKGLLVDGLSSAGTNTISSLRLMLTLPDKIRWLPNYEFNIIDLANKAGYETFWLSNQGFIGEHDTPISAIAKRSSNIYFTKYGTYSSKNTSDFMLVPKLEEILKTPTSAKRFIVVHLYGSHPDAYQRVIDHPKLISINDKKYNYLSCYISSIDKTDKIIKQIYQSLEINKSKFSIVYFSDHGLTHREIDGEIIFNNNRHGRFHYDVPLWKIDYTDISNRKCTSAKSGLNFTEGLAQWLNIGAENLNKNYNLFDCKNDDDDYGLFDSIKNLPQDPAIDITNK